MTEFLTKEYIVHVTLYSYQTLNFYNFFLAEYYCVYSYKCLDYTYIPLFPFMQVQLVSQGFLSSSLSFSPISYTLPLT